MVPAAMNNIPWRMGRKRPMTPRAMKVQPRICRRIFFNSRFFPVRSSITYSSILPRRFLMDPVLIPENHIVSTQTPDAMATFSGSCSFARLLRHSCWRIHIIEGLRRSPQLILLQPRQAVEGDSMAGLTSVLGSVTPIP